MAKLQAIADAIGKDDDTVGATKIVEHTEYAAGVDEVRSVSVTRGGQTLGYLTETSAGRFSFTAPEDAKFNDVAPIVDALEAENVKLGNDDR